MIKIKELVSLWETKVLQAAGMIAKHASSKFILAQMA
jgi:hypothetical protein